MIPEPSALLLTVQLAAATTAILLLVGTPLALWLARTESRLRPLIEATVAMPLVLPPTVLGFYLLVALGPEGPIGGPWRRLGGEPLVFSFGGLLIGSVVYSLPFVVQPLTTTFEGVPRRLTEAAATLGARPLDRFLTVVAPMSIRGFVTAATLGFAHTVGEFGVVLMIGGNIPERTRVVSVAIYDRVEMLDYAAAHRLSLLLLLFAFVVLTLTAWLRRPRKR